MRKSLMVRLHRDEVIYGGLMKLWIEYEIKKRVEKNNVKEF